MKTPAKCATFYGEGFEFRGYVEHFRCRPTMNARTESLSHHYSAKNRQGLSLTEKSKGAMATFIGGVT